MFAVLVEADNDGTAVMLIKDLHMRQWKVTKEQLWNAAKENTKRLLPAECFGMNLQCMNCSADQLRGNMIGRIC